ncbi:AIPR family protein [Deinococcus hopiensis]|uniref:AIPR protein n=1 Tax=Deinococcus hopiensis KR-140 TaxID=695939 RepID=A0A1W1UMF2_9DEIO|nr:AIPR family protein [Deinococcus hopiensis]SMB82203.1 AIPR protein [Deinococcus hopiensis KR-140]
MSTSDLELFVTDLHQEIHDRANRDDGEGVMGFQQEEFTAWCLEQLSDPEVGEIVDWQLSYHAGYGVLVYGYGVNEEDGVLDLFTTIYTQAQPPERVGKEEVDTAFKRLQTFAQKALDGLHTSMDDASPAHDMCLRIFESRPLIRRVRFFLFTDGRTTVKSRDKGRLGDLECSFHVWDIERLHRNTTSGQEIDPIVVDFSRYGEPVPCLRAPEPLKLMPDGYEACLAIFPGQVLARIFEDHGARLLERNVRAFLQVKGQINKGIRDTIIRKPVHFLAYNNGISATAASIEYVMLPGGQLAISQIHDLQIVNGGQTTASLFHALQDKCSLDGIYVQAKLTIVSPERMAGMVPLISKYANSQNKVSDADLAANDEFHVNIEKLSRITWAPAAPDSFKETRWFYERARGQYPDEKTRARRAGVSALKKFVDTYPLQQRFTKTDVAKYINAWEQLPHIVSLGAQKNFNHLGARMDKGERVQVTAHYYQHLVAKGILFRETEKIVQAQRFGGFRANIVAYALALLSHTTGRRVDLDAIWRRQSLSPALREAIEILSHAVHAVIMDPKVGTNIGEWAKKEQCWQLVRQLKVPLPDELEADLAAWKDTEAPTPTTRAASGATSDDPRVAEVMGVPSETWSHLAKWMRRTGKMDLVYLTMVSNLASTARRRTVPTQRQAETGLILLEEARALGFRDPS